ncbi:class I SAM-dependent methyltransferase [Sporosalibacterium faouarense]|uniref:class I SAM-dependent methyltransferase n=1 Tax=Sporosalibacterium faouarense TaxID=516123 RepID=UPI00141C8A95|nr:class I SAM-dependent methyltransferase [Sporosalibacterium faouarense]MTI47890.1 class I SAM-dependent methyltransferase [Bacillota bacterium]
MKDDIINSFNRIALLEDKWDHNQQYEKLLIREISNQDRTALDIGCGTGEFAQKLSKKVQGVYGIDLSPVMIEEAIKRHNEDNIQYNIQDFDEISEDVKYDYIVSIATFHHLNLERALPKIVRLLKENGKLIVLDLYEREGIVDRILDCIAIPANYFLRVLKNGKSVDDEEKAAWEEHSHLDEYMTFKELSNVYKEYLSKEIKLKRLLFWRYMLVYEKK